MAIGGHIKSVGTNTQRGEIHKNGGKFKTKVIDKKVGTDELLGWRGGKTSRWGHIQTVGRERTHKKYL